MARLAGVEPATLGLEGRCSIQLSYKRILVGVERFELPTSCSQSRRATKLRYTPNLNLLFMQSFEPPCCEEIEL